MLIGILLTINLFDSILLANGDCCYTRFYCTQPECAKGRYCADCEVASYYCGVGSCNIFGCNCDGGCRKGNENYWCWNTAFCKCLNSSITEHAETETETETIQLNELDLVDLVFNADQNSDKHLDRMEFQQLIQNTFTGRRLNQINVADEFRKLDLDQNELISYNEIDMDLF